MNKDLVKSAFQMGYQHGLAKLAQIAGVQHDIRGGANPLVTGIAQAPKPAPAANPAPASNPAPATGGGMPAPASNPAPAANPAPATGGGMPASPDANPAPNFAERFGGLDPARQEQLMRINEAIERMRQAMANKQPGAPANPEQAPANPAPAAQPGAQAPAAAPDFAKQFGELTPEQQEQLMRVHAAMQRMREMMQGTGAANHPGLRM